MTQRLGAVVSGSLTGGLEVRLDTTTPIESVAVGRYVTIQGEKRRFFGMITDIGLGVTDPQITASPPSAGDSLISEVLRGTGTYGTIHVQPYLVIGGDVDSITEGPQPVKTIPGHFSTVNLATDDDIELVFGKEDSRRFHVGNPLDMETKLCLDLQEFVTRSNGIFGKSGTGKTFFTRILLCGMLQKSRAVNLIFDMHNEYGWLGSHEGKGAGVKGLKQLFAAKVAVFTLDEENARRRGVSTDYVVRIGYSEIDPEDIGLLSQTLNLSPQATNAVYQLRREFKQDWIQKTLDAQPDDEETGKLLLRLAIHDSTYQNLRRGLIAVTRLAFINPSTRENAVGRILEYLDRGINVVLEFGRYSDIMAYMLVANLLSRRIYLQYRERTETALAQNTARPIPLVITIEEAHKFLNPEIASQTIFGTIAREMRKYNVTLLVIDQRPSGIDEEVMSQMGTKITFLLDNEKDVDSVLAGVSGKSELKSVLARLAPKQQALVFGHALPMPVAFQPREYGSAESYRSFLPHPADPRQTEKDIENLWK